MSARRDPDEKPVAPDSERAGGMRPIGEVIGDVVRKLAEKMRSRDAA